MQSESIRRAATCLLVAIGVTTWTVLTMASPGAEDKLPESVDTRCPAMYQGKTRIEITRNYWGYIQTFPDWQRNARLVEVPGIGHEGDNMLRSRQFLELVYPTTGQSGEKPLLPAIIS